MKTLDEVIKAIECDKKANCEDCPYYKKGKTTCDGDFEADALHYLMEFQGLSKMWNDRLDKEQENSPLTWDELRQMEGKPVWVEDSFDNGEWYIIECFTASNRFVAYDRWGDTTLFNKKEMDDVWKAYRREHHEN